MVVESNREMLLVVEAIITFPPQNEVVFVRESEININVNELEYK